MAAACLMVAVAVASAGPLRHVPGTETNNESHALSATVLPAVRVNAPSRRKAVLVFALTRRRVGPRPQAGPGPPDIFHWARLPLCRVFITWWKMDVQVPCSRGTKI